MPLGNKITSQILIELALATSGEHDEAVMLRKTLNLYLRKLNCFLAATFFYTDDNIVLDNDYILPIAHKNSDELKAVRNEVLHFFKSNKTEIYISELNDKFYYGFEIASYGIIILGRTIPFYNEFIYELRPIIDNLGKSLRLTREIKKTYLLNEKLSLLEAFVNNSKDSFQASDINGDIVYLNNEAARKFGINNEEPYGLNVKDFEQSFRDNNVWEKHVQQLRIKQQIIESQNYHVAENKNIAVEVSVSLTKTNNKEYVVAISRDITERKKNEDTIKHLNNVYSSLLRISSQLLTGNINNTNILIKDAFALLSKHLNAVRIYLYEFSDTNKQFVSTSEWHSSSEREMGVLAKSLNIKGNEAFVSDLYTKKHIIYNYKNEPDFIQNIKLFNTVETSTLIVPILFEDKITGFAGIDSTFLSNEWYEEIISVIKISLNIISNSLARYKQNRRLEETKQFYEGILNELPNDIVVFDEQHRYIYLNPAGIKDNELRKWIIGKTDFDYIERRKVPTEKAIERRKYFHKSINDKCKISWNEFFYNKAGDKEVINRNFYPVFNSDGTLKMMIGYGINITGVFNLEKNQNILLSIIENIPATVIYYANNNKDFFINEFGKKQLGINNEEDISWLSLENLHDEKSLDLVINEGIKTVNNEGYWRGEVTINRKNESSFYADEIILKNNVNNEVGLALIITDISEKVSALDEIKSLASFPLENPNPVLRYDVDGNLIFSNDASSILVKLFEKQYKNKLPSKISKQIRDSIIQEQPYTGEIFIDEYIFKYNIHPNKAELYANFYAEDITEKKKQEDQIRQTDILLRSLSEAAAALLSEDPIALRLNKSLFNVGVNIIANECHIITLNKIDNSSQVIARWSREGNDEYNYSSIYKSVLSHKSFLKQLLDNNHLHLNSNSDNNFYGLFNKGNAESFTAFSQDFDFETTLIIAFHFKIKQKHWSEFEIDIIRTYLDYITGTLHREKLLNELHEKQLIQKTLLDASPDNIMLIKADGTIVEANYRYQETLNISPRQIIGKNIRSLFNNKVSEKRLEYGLKALTTKTPVFFEDSRDGYYFETNVHPVLNDKNEVIYIATYARDITHRKIAENEVRVAKQKLESILNEIQDVLWSLDIVSKKYNFITPSIEKMYGYTIAEFETDHTLWEKMVHPDDKHFINVINENVYKYGNSDVEYRVITKTGETKWIKNKIKVIYEKGIAVRMDGYAIDITNQKNYEKEILESEERYRIILDNSSEMIQTLDLEGKIVWTNRSWKEKLGVTEEQVKGESIIQFFDNTTHEEFNRVIPKVMEGNIVTDLQCTFISKNGNALILQGRAIPLYRDNKLIGSQAYLHDVTKIIQAEYEYRTILENSSEMIQTLDLEGKIVWTNRSWKEKLGFNKDQDIIGHQLIQFLDEPTLEEFSRVIPKVMEGKIVTDLNCTFLSINKDSLLLQGRVIPLYKDGVLVGSQAYLHDITKLKIAEKELEKLNESLEQLVDERTAELNETNKHLQNFAYVISHDLKAPVRHTTMFTQMLKSKIENKLNGDELRLLNNISLAGDKMGKLIDGILEFNKLGNKPLIIKQVNTFQLVTRIIEMYKALNAELKINIEIDQLPDINADDALIEQVFTNLISNAIKYSSKQPVVKVEIRYNDKGKHHEFTIKDNGTGFDMKHSANMFNMFTRLHTPGEFEGNGIGLANTKRIIERHKGTINFYSEPNKGAAFYFTIPK